MPNAWDKLVAKKWDELEALEYGDRLLFPEVIRARTKSGSIKEVPIVLRPLRKHERRKARLEDAVPWAEELEIDREKEPALFEDLDTLCILARAIREPKEPYDQLRTAKQLEHEYDMRSLEEIWSKYKVYEDLTDPRDPIQTDLEFWAVVAAMGRTRNILPLTECESLAQNACILRLVDLALSSPTFRSWLTPSESSTPVS